MVSGLAEVIMLLRESGFPLVLLWLLTLAIVYGLLQHANTPKSVTARSVIAITAAFLVLLAAAATPAIAFLENLVVASVLIAFGLIVTVIVLEIAGVGITAEKSIFKAHPKAVGGIIIILVILVFLGAGGLYFLNLPTIKISDTIIAFVVFIGVMIGAVALMVKETKKKED